MQAMCRARPRWSRRRGRAARDRCRGCGRRACGATAAQELRARPPASGSDSGGRRPGSLSGVRAVTAPAAFDRVDPGAQAARRSPRRLSVHVAGQAPSMGRAAEAGRVAAFPCVERGRRWRRGSIRQTTCSLASTIALAGDGRTRGERGRRSALSGAATTASTASTASAARAPCRRIPAARAHDRGRLSEGRWSREPGAPEPRAAWMLEGRPAASRRRVGMFSALSDRRSPAGSSWRRASPRSAPSGRGGR